jgi:hypothetical protein
MFIAYLPIIIPGILAQTILTGSVAIGVNLRDDMDKGVFDRFRSLPIARIAPLAGALIADAIRYVIVTVLTFSMGYIMGLRPQAGFTGVLEASCLVIFFAWCTSWIFAFFGCNCQNSIRRTGYIYDNTFSADVFVQRFCAGKDLAQTTEMVCGSQPRIASGKRYPDTFAGRENQQRLLAEPDRRTGHYGRFFILHRESIYPQSCLRFFFV